MVQWQVIVLFINSPVQDSNNDTGVSFIYHYSLILQLPVPITQVEHIQVIPWGVGGGGKLLKTEDRILFGKSRTIL